MLERFPERPVENWLPTLHAFSFGPDVIEDILTISPMRRPVPEDIHVLGT